MAWFRSGGGISAISLIDNLRIGTSATDEYISPYDSYNYISVVGTEATLTRNNYTHHLFVFTPLLVVGKKYAICFDGITNTDGKFYIQKFSDKTTNPLVTTRIETNEVSSVLSPIKGIVLIPNETAYYGIAIWKNNTSPIKIENPVIYELSN